VSSSVAVCTDKTCSPMDLYRQQSEILQQKAAVKGGAGAAPGALDGASYATRASVRNGATSDANATDAAGGSAADATGSASAVGVIAQPTSHPGRLDVRL